jgi:hypothetical protein
MPLTHLHSLRSRHHHHMPQGRSCDGPLVVALLLAAVVSGWVGICTIVGWKEGRMDLGLWAAVAWLPSIAFFLILLHQIRSGVCSLPPWRVLCICGTAIVMYVLVLIAESAAVAFLFNMGEQAGLQRASSWWASLLLVSLFAFFVPACMEETGKFLICTLNQSRSERRVPLSLGSSEELL